MTDQLSVVSTISLDKNDIVAIAVAEAEKKILQNITRCRQDAEEYVKLIDKKLKELEESSLEMITDHATKELIRIKGLLPGIEKLNLLIGHNMHVGHFVHTEDDLEDEVNFQGFTVFLEMDDRRQNKRQLTIFVKYMKPSKIQIKGHKLLQELEAKKQKVLETGVEWKRKQADIPALERQMRAQVAREEMDKTKQGQAIVKAMLDKLDDTLLMIGA